MSSIDVGDVVRVSTTPGFENAAGALADPTDVRLKWRVAGGVETTWVYQIDAQIARDSVGLYHADIPVAVAGPHFFRWEGTGAVTAAEEGSFSVETMFLSPSVTSVAEVRALVNSRLSDVDLQTVIDREEAWLAGKIGVLTGERTDTFTPGIGDTPLYLSRRAPSVVLTDDGRTLAASEFLFTPSTGMIRRIWSPDLAGSPPWRQLYLGWQGTVTATYTPSDEAAVKSGVISLVRGTVGETGFVSETIGGYSYSRSTSGGAIVAGLSRAGLVRSILLRRPGFSLRLRSAMEAS